MNAELARRRREKLSVWRAALLTMGLMAATPAAASPDGPPPDWFRALAAMPVSQPATLSRSNAIRLVLENFQSNATVCAIVFLPGVPDDFYLIHRDQPIGARATNLGEVVATLTNLTPVRAAFTHGVLRLHTESDVLEPMTTTVDPRFQRELEQKCGLPRVLWMDSHWRSVQPILARGLHCSIRPGSDSPDAWHFERVNLAAYGLTNWELVNLLASATGTRVSAQRRTIVFERPKN